MDTYDFLTDPRALPLDERRAASEHFAAEQRSWLIRLERLVEPPVPDPDFPAFLLATPAFRDLARRLDHVETRSELPTDVADELDWFVTKFADYLRTCEGEDVFSSDTISRDTGPGNRGASDTAPTASDR